MKAKSSQLGFTLVEMVVTIVITGIIVLGITNFIEFGASGYNDSIERQRVQNEARFVTERLTREIRHAVPNSLEVFSGGQCLSYVPTVYSIVYKDLPNTAGELFRFSVVYPKQNFTFSRGNGFNLVINPTSADDLNTATSAQSISLDGATKDTVAITQVVGDDKFYQGSTLDSSAKRGFVYATKAVVCIESGGLTYQREGYKKLKLADLVVSGSFDIGQDGTSFSISRASHNVVHLSLLFENIGEQVTYEQDIKVLNAP